jgi:hypothetical protein
MTVGDVPTIWLDLAESWLYFEDLAGIDTALRQFLAAGGLDLEQINDDSWGFDGSGKAVVLAVDRFLDAQGLGSVCQRHEDSRYSWALRPSDTADVPDAPLQGDDPKDVLEWQGWSEIVLAPVEGGVTVRLSPTADEPIYRLLTIRGYRITSCRPDPGGDNCQQFYQVTGDVGTIRATMTEWLLRQDLTYIKSVTQPGGSTQIVITDRLP